jgi:hypothetical protein
MLKKLPGLSDAKAKDSTPLAKDLKRLIRAFDAVTVDGARLSDDFAFCHRWHEGCGGEIWANIEAPVTHLGLHRFTARYADAAGGPRITVKTGAPVRVGGTKSAVPAAPKKNGGKPARK